MQETGNFFGCRTDQSLRRRVFAPLLTLSTLSLAGPSLFVALSSRGGLGDRMCFQTHPLFAVQLKERSRKVHLGLAGGSNLLFGTREPPPPPEPARTRIPVTNSLGPFSETGG